MKPFACALLATFCAANTLTFQLERVPSEESHTIRPHRLTNGHGEPLLGRGPDGVEDNKSTELQITRSAFRYQAPMFFGTSKNEGRMAFDTGSPFTTVTSDICSNCHTKVYKPGTSDLEENLGTQWEIDIEQSGHTVELKVMAFTDIVCLGNSNEDFCVDDFKFYPIYEQKHLSRHEDGILGMAPKQTQKKRAKDGPSFIDTLRKQGKIDRSVVSLFVSRFASKPHTIQIGDYDAETYVVGGDNNLEWYSLTVDNMGWKWQTDLTDAYLGEQKLFTHDFKWVEINSGYAGIGLTSEDFEKASRLILNVDPTEIYCDDTYCFGKNACNNYADLLPDLKFTLSSRVTYTVPGHKLVQDRDIVIGAGRYQCEMLLFNSDDHYRLGSIFLEDYYSVYDIDNFKVGLGKVVDFEAVDPHDEAYDSGSATHETTGDGTHDAEDGQKEQDEVPAADGDEDTTDETPAGTDDSNNNDSQDFTDDNASNEKTIDDAEKESPADDDSPHDENNLRNALIFSAIALIFTVFAIYCCKKRRDEARRLSGSQQARGQRKKLPLTEEDPNRSLLEAQERDKDLQFIVSTEVDEEDEEEPGSIVDDEKELADPSSAIAEANKNVQHIEDLLA